MHYFFAHIDFENQEVILEKEEAHHCATVLRLKQGDLIGVFDLNDTSEKRSIFQAELIRVHKKQCIGKIKTTTLFQPPSISIHLVISPPKNNERLEWLAEKSVELQASVLLFVKSERCIRKNLNIDRIKNILASAAKQSINPILPEIIQFNSLNTLLNSINTKDALYLLLHCEPSGRKIFITPSFLQQIKEKGIQHIYAFIGPEGDWTKEEINLILSTLPNVFEIDLLPTRLRTETAAICILSSLRIILRG